MKRFMLSIAALALLLVATENASAQTIISGGYYPSSGVVYSTYTTPVYAAPVYAAPVYYSYPSYGYAYPSYGYGYGYGPSISYSTRVGSGRLSVGYGPYGGWGVGYRGWGGGWRGWR